jgi:hypothetical protein
VDRDEQDDLGTKQGRGALKGLELMTFDVHLDEGGRGHLLFRDDLGDGLEGDGVITYPHLVRERIPAPTERDGAASGTHGGLDDPDVADVIPGQMLSQEPKVRFPGSTATTVPEGPTMRDAARDMKPLCAPRSKKHSPGWASAWSAPNRSRPNEPEPYPRPVVTTLHWNPWLIPDLMRTLAFPSSR